MDQLQKVLKSKRAKSLNKKTGSKVNQFIAPKQAASLKIKKKSKAKQSKADKS